MSETPEVVSQKPVKKSNIFVSVVIVLICLYGDVWLWSLCSKALTARSDILPLLGIVGYAAAALVWIPIIQWMIRRHSS